MEPNQFVYFTFSGLQQAIQKKAWDDVSCYAIAFPILLMDRNKKDSFVTDLG